MEEILTVHFLALVLAYATLSWFVGHQGSHLVAVSKGDAELNPTLGLLIKLTSSVPVYIGILVWVGYRTHWYYPLILFACGFLIRPLVFLSVERAFGWDRSAWAYQPHWNPCHSTHDLRHGLSRCGAIANLPTDPARGN
jgi:hypothetical protein